MTVALLLITHQPLGHDLVAVASTILGEAPVALEALEIDETASSTAFIEQGLASASRLDEGAGVLVLTDLYGSTPANIALAIQARAQGVQVLTGLNLPMLLRALNYASLTLDEVTYKALEGAHAGIRLCSAHEVSD